MSQSQMTYLKYFDQILKGFIPLSKTLLLSKIILVSNDINKGDDEDEHNVLTDPNDFAKGLYFKVVSNGKVIFDQLDNANKDLSGNIINGIGETLVNVNTQVTNDFQVICYSFSHIERQVGVTCCLHSAFIEDNFARLTINDNLNIDLILFDQCYIN